MMQLPNPENPLRIGTRASPLAMAQANMTVAALIAAHGLAPESLEIVPMTATGDRILDRALAEVGGKALWTRELDFALDGHEIDIAVHSLKDVETERDARFALAAMLERADPRDRLVVPQGTAASSIMDLPAGTRLGTSSPRRAAQVRRIRPDIQTKLLRGNVATRLSRLAEGDVDATLLAAAGLDRLGMYGVGHVQERDLLLPAASQGAIGIECRSDDVDTLALIRAINHEPTYAAVAAERAFLAGLGGDCRSPVAAHAYFMDNGTLWLDAEIYSADGSDCVASSTVVQDENSAKDLARQMLDAASPDICALFGG
jgi:hydroxymethylbilane synthase